MELKKQGLSTAEIARRSAAVARGEEPPPPGVDPEVSNQVHHGGDHSGHTH